MRALIMSDVHLEFETLRPPPTDDKYDIVLLAGDIGVGPFMAVDWINETFPKDIPKKYILGNHEFYGRESFVKLPYTIKQYAKAHGNNIEVLDGDYTTIDDIKVWGGTLWTDYRLFGNEDFAMQMAERQMNDFRQICGITPQLVQQKHFHQRKSLKIFMEKNKKKKTIIMSHHAPSMKSGNAHGGGVLDAAYISNLEELITDYEPDLWVHGHTHNPKDYKIGKTMIISNPRGYPDEHLKFYYPLIIDV